MSQQVFPTKGNLIASKKSLALAKLGYDLLDRKRNILIREIMMLTNVANELKGSIDKAYKDAYDALRRANISLGIISGYAKCVPVDKGLNLSTRSVMGTELVSCELPRRENKLYYGLSQTDSKLDEAFGTGTAAVISPVGTIQYKNETLTINNGKMGKITEWLYDQITGIQTQRLPDPFGWVYHVE